MANNATIAHRFANKDFGKYGTLQGSSTHIEGRNYYSYSTIFGQWVDIANNVCVIYTGDTTPSSTKHKLSKRMFPDDAHVFPYDEGGEAWYYHGCNLVGWLRNDSDFKTEHRMKLLEHYVTKMYDQFARILTSRIKGLEKINFEHWGYFEELCSLYKDISVKKYLNALKGRSADVVSKRKMVRLLASGERDVETITDAMFGAGSYKKYWDYCARFRKAADKRKHVENICKYLGIASPYETSWGQQRLPHQMSAEQIRKLTANERLALKWEALEYKKGRAVGYANEKKLHRNMTNAYRWIVGFEPKMCAWVSSKTDGDVTKCTNMFTGQVYDCGQSYVYGVYWAETNVEFKYGDFSRAEDKEQWIRDFYAKCAEVEQTRKAISVLREKGVVAQKEHSWDNDRYIYNDEFADRCTEEEKTLCADYIAKQDAYFHDQELRERAERLERERRRAEEEKERLFQEQAKKERIDQLLAEGVTGIQSMWREHLASIEQANQYFHEVAFADEQGAMYNGGNVLLRFNLDKTRVQTSKGVDISIDVCKAMWKYVKAWHETPASFKEREINTKLSGTYTIISYENDVLTAGCHKIAYAEMERMYNEIINA